MKTIHLIEKYWYILLVIIIILSLLSLKSNSNDITGSVILNLHKQNNNYEIENPSQIKINVTIKSQNLTESIILNPNQILNISENNFTAIGEKYE